MTIIRYNVHEVTRNSNINIHYNINIIRNMGARKLIKRRSILASYVLFNNNIYKFFFNLLFWAFPWCSLNRQTQCRQCVNFWCRNILFSIPLYQISIIKINVAIFEEQLSIREIPNFPLNSAKTILNSKTTIKSKWPNFHFTFICDKVNALYPSLIIALEQSAVMIRCWCLLIWVYTFRYILAKFKWWELNWGL